MNGDAIRRLWHRLQAIVARARMLLFDDSGPVQLVQVRIIGDEVKDQVPRMADYGFVSVPPAGSDAVLVFLSGERSSGIIIATNHQTFRMRNLADGEVAIHDDKGRFVLLAADGITVQGKDDPITVETTSNIVATAGGDITATAGGSVTLHASSKITLSAPQVEVDATMFTVKAAVVVQGDTSITGDVATVGALTNNGDDVGNTHDHLPGGYHIGSSPVMGNSGGVTP